MKNFLKASVQAPVRLYRAAISPLLAPSCRFYPTCSAYMLQAIERHGVLKGGLLGLRRILSCHPWHKACGHDPVPEVFDWAGLIRYKRRITSITPRV